MSEEKQSRRSLLSNRGFGQCWASSRTCLLWCWRNGSAGRGLSRVFGKTFDLSAGRLSGFDRLVNQVTHTSSKPNLTFRGNPGTPTEKDWAQAKRSLRKPASLSVITTEQRGLPQSNRDWQRCPTPKALILEESNRTPIDECSKIASAAPSDRLQ